ncbi:hypothetical protein CI109_103091 [Kwoniella shandongensis]|uniref:Uncharacterized protein n=1 Tax=Kwoniella shandongensis TaxID=1734106 RepID=A0A5M6C945_9TREE|nr:uncharacterized protein CI109_000282 [Kwoniella shandongensis]KAA5531441.1 hypothetical protein CI109_000282 [Kwoniella shandongensis]
MSPSNPSNESDPLLPLSISASGQPSTPTGPASRRLQARRYISPHGGVSSLPQIQPSSHKGKGKARAISEHDDDEEMAEESGSSSSDEGGDTQSPSKSRAGTQGKGRAKEGLGSGSGVGAGTGGRLVTIIFGNESDASGRNLDIWVEEGENVGSVKEQIRHLRPALSSLNLRLIHSGRLLTDGILLIPWLRSLEERVRRQAAGVGGEMESVLKDVGLGEEDDDGAQKESRKREGSGQERVWLHCIVGGKEEQTTKEEEDVPAAPQRRGFDVLLDAGLSAAEVAQMRRQFYESRGEEVPEGMDMGDVNDEHARALEEQWIEGDMTAETATTSTEGLYTSILHGLLTGFLFPLIPWFFFRELPLPNFFDADAEAAAQAQSHSNTSVATTRRASNGHGASASASASAGNGGGGGGIPDSAVIGDTEEMVTARRIAARWNLGAGVGGEPVQSQVFGKRMQMGILLGTILNIAFGVLRLMN